jgi:syntaxin-binding protein 1
MLEDYIKGTLDQNVFPFTKPQLDATDGIGDAASQSSLRSAKPTWAKSRMSMIEPRQRIIVFVAGGATYSEARSCYEVSKASSRDVFMATSHMLTPGLFVRQVGDLSVDRRRLDIPADRPPPKAPAHLFEKEPTPRPPPMSQPGITMKSSGLPPTAALDAMTLNSGGARPTSRPDQAPTLSTSADSPGRKQEKKDKKDKDGEKKKKHFFTSKK